MTKQPIAIIGIGCRFPGKASNPQKFWELLCQGKDAIIDVPPDRWDLRRFYDSNNQIAGKMNAKRGGFLQEKWDEFDPEFFHISPREANFLDPQQRVLLEITWEALEDAGIPADKIKGTNSSVFVGAFTTDWQTLQNSPFNRHHCDIYSGINGSKTILSARLSHFFDLRGPCLTVDTACSSSLVAIHLACQSLWQKESHLAFAAGVNAMLTPETTIAMSKGRFLNPSGQCRSFDAEAKGYVRGEGAGVVILKLLSEALKDGDPIYALIRNTGINQDGHTPGGITQPNAHSQTLLIKKVLEDSAVHPSSIQYVEAHGTGTPAGDPTEAAALDQVLNHSERNSCWMGSVKTNIGHLEAAAGIAGLIKTALCLKHQQIPPNLHFDNPNPHIPFDTYCLKVPTSLINLNFTHACVNAFGYGGTNANALLQSYERKSETKKTDSETTSILPFSGKSQEELKAVIATVSHFLEEHPTVALPDLAHTLTHNKSVFDYRLALSAKNIEELKTKLADNPIQGKKISDKPKLTFIFTGMGPQWWGMGRDLLEHSPLFLKTIQKCDQIIQQLAGWSLLEELSKSEDHSRMNEPEVSQAANCSLQIALTDVLYHWGIHPDFIVGHSIGEVAAAYASGILTIEECLTVSYHRSRLQATKKNQGTMLAVGLSLQDANQILGQYQGAVSLAAENSPYAVTLAGSNNELQEIADALEKKNIFNRFLKVNIAYHSNQMDGLEDAMHQALKKLSPQKANVPFYSTVTTDRCELLDNIYWWKNVRQPVRFASTIKRVIEEGSCLFLEIGPHPVLSTSLQEILQHEGANGASVATLNRKKMDRHALQDCICGLYVHGYELQWNLINPAGNFIRLPNYPWRKKSHWIESVDSIQYRLGSRDFPFLSRKLNSPIPSWQVELNKHHFPWLDDHQIENSVIFPAAGYVEAALEMHATIENKSPCRLEDIFFHQFLPIEENKEATLQLSLDKESGSFRVYSQETDWICHASGKWFTTVLEPKITCSSSQNEPTDEDIYSLFAKMGLKYGPNFQCIKKLWKDKKITFSKLEIESELNYLLDPRLLDGAFQTLIGTLEKSTISKGVILPYKIEQLIFYKSPKKTAYCRAEKIELTAHQLIGNLTLFDEDGNLCAQISGLTCKILSKRESVNHEKLVYHYDLIEKPLSLEPNVKQLWFVEDESLKQMLLAKGHTCFALSELDSKNGSLVLICPHTPIEHVQETENKLAIQLLHIAKEIEKHPEKTFHAWIITQGLSGASLWGLGRVLRQELPNLKCSFIDFDQPEFLEQLILELEFSKDEEILYSKGKRFARKLMRLSQNHSKSGHTLQNYGLELKTPGKIESLFFQENERKQPKDYEVEIQIETASLNFKDLMKILGLLNEEALRGTYFGSNFGMECSGTIISTGRKVTNYRVGDRVCAFTPNAFQSFVTVNQKHICNIPSGCSLQEAAIYVPFLTVLRALKDVAKLKKGETVLIHSATGAVGLAAIQYALSVGAQVFATAGSEDKRKYLQELGVQQCSDSRSLEFVEDIKQWTEGKGVDVVLNSLGGEFLAKSWGLLAPYGRFIEIGKKDISLNSQLPMREFDRNTTFASIDMDRMFKEESRTIKRLLKETYSLFEDGVFKPLPIKIFPASEVKEAFQYMARSKHIGKIMLQFGSQQVKGIKKQVVDPNGTYLITGGLSGFGLMSAQWLVEKGAKHLLLIGRSGASTSKAKRAVADFHKKGINLKIGKADITNYEELKKLLNECQATMPAIKGVIHSAMVLKDAFIGQMTSKMMNDVLKPKIDGCVNLHRLTQNMDLDFFILYSSISSVVGNLGQGNYAAANAFLDTFCTYRNRLGLPALTINWGALQTGVLERETQVADHLKKHGITPLEVQKALDVLEMHLDTKGQFICADIQWDLLLKAFSGLNKSFEFSEFQMEGHSPESVLLAMESSQRLAYVVEIVRDKVGKTLKMDPSAIERNVRLNTLGIDSLMTMELQSSLENEIGVRVPTMELMKGPTVDQLAQVILRQIN